MFLMLSILFTSLLILGFTIASQKGMIFHFITVFFEGKKKDKIYSIYDMLFLCIWCMPTIWSIFGYTFTSIFLHEFKMEWLIFYPITICASSILNGLIWGLHNKLY